VLSQFLGRVHASGGGIGESPRHRRLLLGRYRLVVVWREKRSAQSWVTSSHELQPQSGEIFIESLDQIA
jgi:hypothetical protein